MNKLFEQNRIFSFFLGVLLLTSFITLSTIESRQQNSVNQQSWWAVYFVEPSSNTMDFVIENHTENNQFHWEVILEKTKTHEADIDVAKSTSKKVSVSTENLSGKKVTIRIIHNEEIREIYKILE